MPDKIIQLNANDYEQATEFLAKAFGADSTGWFRDNLSTCYYPTDEVMQCSYAVKRNGHIVAMAGGFPSVIEVGDHTLNNVGIGGVSVDESCRGEGLMNLLMGYILDNIDNSDVQISRLGGMRHRYRFFGWERAGAVQTARITKNNIKRQFGDQPSNITFADLDKNNSHAIDTIYSLHNTLAIRCNRSRDMFYRFLTNWEMIPRVAYDINNKIVGCIVYSPKKIILSELFATDVQTAGRILQELIICESADFDMHMAPIPTGISRFVQSFAETSGTINAGNWQIFDWQSTVDALIQLQYKFQPLTPGCVVINITDRDICIEISVTDNAAKCAITTTNKPDLEVSSLLATQLLCGPLKPSLVLPLPMNALILDAWCPLPLWLCHQDCV